MTIYFIYHPPSECMGRDICTPLHSASARIYLMHLQNVWAWIYALPFTAGRPGNITCLQSIWARIYPLPFTVGQPGNIMCLQSAWAGIYPLPFTAGRPGNVTCLQSAWAGISTPLHSGLAGKYHMPSERMGQDICITVSTTLSQFGLGLGISKWHSFPFWVPELQNGAEVSLSNFFGT